MSIVTRSQTSLLQNAAMVLAAACGGTAYLLSLSGYYDWWIVLPAALLTYPTAMLVAAFLLLCCEERLSRWIVLLLGSGLAWAGLSEPGRFPTLLMGIVFLLIGLSASKPFRPDPTREADQVARRDN